MQMDLVDCIILFLHTIILLVLFGYVEQKLLERSQISLFFLKSNFFGSEK
jgi:hypothetical protein